MYFILKPALCKPASHQYSAPSSGVDSFCLFFRPYVLFNAAFSLYVGVTPYIHLILRYPKICLAIMEVSYEVKVPLAKLPGNKLGERVREQLTDYCELSTTHLPGEHTMVSLTER